MLKLEKFIISSLRFVFNVNLHFAQSNSAKKIVFPEVEGWGKKAMLPLIQTPHSVIALCINNPKP